MKFSSKKDLSFPQAVEILFSQLGAGQVMALGASTQDHVTVRLVSCLCKGEKLYFKTDRDFPKTRQLLENPQVALCWSGVQVEGLAKNLGLLTQQGEDWFPAAFMALYANTYQKYSHKAGEILIEITPTLVEVWDTSEEGYACQIFIDFSTQAVTVVPYEQPGEED